MTTKTERTRRFSFRHKAKRIKRGPIGHVVARFGLASRAIIYLTLAGLMADLAVTGHNRETDQGGALHDLGATEPGTVLLVVFAIGSVCYTAWRWSEAAFGRQLEHLSRPDRVKAFIEGACYLPFGIAAFAVSGGDTGSADQAGSYRSASASVIHSGAGRVLLGAVGVVIVLVGAFMFSEGPRRSFAGDLQLERTTPAWRRFTMTTGIVGATTRGAVFALAGVLVIVAAATSRPSKAGGVDTAVHAIADAPFGRFVLVAAALGVASFGLFALAEARWRRIG
jgi:hypothetical protein